MGDKSDIEWTDASWNCITGCSVLTTGCEHCYAMRLAAGFLSHMPHYQGLTNRHGKWNGEVRFVDSALDKPIRWRRPRRIFVNSMGDLFHEKVPDEWIHQVYAVMGLAPHHTFQVLTKRPERMREYLTGSHVYQGILRAADAIRARHRKRGLSRIPISDPNRHASFWPHVWHGVSIEDQKRADERVPVLLECPAAVRFVSAEPLLGPIDLTALPVPEHYEHDPPRHWITANLSRRWNALAGFTYLPRVPGTEIATPRLGWGIVGGESGPGARPMEADWARSMRDQCASADVAFFMKQMAKKTPIPDDLFVREMPA